MTALVSVKVHFNNVIRRVGMDFFVPAEWTAFCERLQDLFGSAELAGLESGQKYTVTYLDNEQDKITISSSPELQEALRTPIQTLHISIDPKIGKATTTATPATMKRCQKQQRCTARNGRGKWSCSNPKDANDRAIRLLGVGALEPALAVLEDGIRRFHHNSKLHYNLACCRAKLGELDGAVAAMCAAISLGYNDVSACLKDENLHVLRTHPGFADALTELLQNLKDKGQAAAESSINELLCGLLDRDFVAAGVLAQALEGVQGNLQSYSLFYNLACLHCKAGDMDKAIQMVRHAIQKGFTGIDHLLTDPDLEKLRGTDSFKELVTILEAMNPSQPPVVDEQTSSNSNAPTSPSLSSISSQNSGIVSEPEIVPSAPLDTLPPALARSRCSSETASNASGENGSHHSAPLSRGASSGGSSSGASTPSLINEPENTVVEAEDDDIHSIKDEEEIEIVDEDEVAPPENRKWEDEIAQIRGMGFDAVEPAALHALLEEHGGAVQQVVAALVD